jgi:glycosyltransferase involved in cell wall biosynthesis
VLRAVLDARDGAGSHLRGWGWYVKALVTALRDQPELDLRTVDRGWPGPETLFELAGLPRAARGADVLHVPNCFLPPHRPCPGVVTVHDLAFEAYPGDFARATALKYRAWTPRAVRSAERVIVPSAFTKRDVVERYRIDERKVHVIPEAPVLAIGTAQPPTGPYLLAVGDLRRKKNFAALAAAYVQLRDRGLPHRLIVAGLDAGEGPAIRAAAAGHPLELPGYVPDPELDALIRGADLLVHPSLYEGFGLILVEAMARAIPLVVAYSTALPDTAGDAAMYFEPGDSGDMRSAILRALKARDGLIAAGQRRVAQLSWAQTAAETVEVYREAAAA